MIQGTTTGGITDKNMDTLVFHKANKSFLCLKFANTQKEIVRVQFKSFECHAYVNFGEY